MHDSTQIKTAATSRKCDRLRRENFAGQSLVPPAHDVSVALQ
jgi:hypothetical protein